MCSCVQSAGDRVSRAHRNMVYCEIISSKKSVKRMSERSKLIPYCIVAKFLKMDIGTFDHPIVLITPTIIV